jgi:MSHA pilin protein MshA
MSRQEVTMNVNVNVNVNTNKQVGFTLIELIMVIVILGILSAFALPRFADLSGNAEAASIAGALASAKSSSAIVHASALANNSTGTVSLEGTVISIINGYPDAGGLLLSNGTNAANAGGIALAANIDSDFVIIYGDVTSYGTAGAATANTAADRLIVTLSPTAATNPCFTYSEAASENSPVFGDVAQLSGTGTGPFTCP